jgi:predicted transcriptional regulator
MKQQELDWRRSKVLELSSRGYSEREISEILKLNDTAVHRDLAYIRKQAHENIQQHIHETVPEEYQKCMVGMKRTLKQILEISESAADPRTKLQAHAIAIDIYKNIMDLATNGVIVNDALQITQSKVNMLNGVDTNNIPKSNEIITTAEDEPEGEGEGKEKTTNGVF